MGACSSKKQSIKFTLYKSSPVDIIKLNNDNQPDDDIISFSQREYLQNATSQGPTESPLPLKMIERKQLQAKQHENIVQEEEVEEDEEVASNGSVNSQQSKKARKKKKKKLVARKTTNNKNDNKGPQTIHNFLMDLGEIEETTSINGGLQTDHQTSNRLYQTQQQVAISSKLKKIRPESAASALSIAESEYRYIPNNFKKDGVAFNSTKINFDAGISGIYNMGNTCFMSTAVQCLSAVQPLTDFFIADLHQVSLNKTNPMGSEGNVTVKFANLVKNLWSGKDAKIYPLEFLKILAQYASHLVSGQQQDAQEFLAYLLDVLHEDLNRADKLTKKTKFNDDTSSTEAQELTEEQQELMASESWKEHLCNNRSIIVDLFQGQLKSTLKCMRCNYVSLKFDTFMYLSVPIPHNLIKQPTLQQCVQEFTKEEILDNDDKWRCPRCKSFQKTIKKIDIWKLPSILIVHLKRFEFTEQKRAKIRDYVDFPLKNLDLTPYVSKLQRAKPIYDLFAVMNHEGFLGGGHYYSYTKHRMDQQWYYFNDEQVSKIKKVEQVVSADAYILFYSKMSVDEFCRQTLSEPGLWPHVLQEPLSTKSVAKTTNARIDIAGQNLASKTVPVKQIESIPKLLNQFQLQKKTDTIAREDDSERYSSTSKQQYYDQTNAPYHRETTPFDNDPYSQMKSEPQPPDRYNSALQNDYASNNNLSQQNPKLRFATNYSTSPQKMIGQMIAGGGANGQIFSKNLPQHQSLQQLKKTVINNNSNNYYINLYMNNRDAQ